MRTVFFRGPGGGDDDDKPAGRFVIPLPLRQEELRVLGCLIEKSFLTPDVYPLTMNSILTACNQKSSREPIVNYDEATVDAVLVMLQGKGLCAKITGVDHRVPKFKERFSEQTGFRVSEIAVLTVMMLRGPQTVNELKVRTERIHSFADHEEVESVLDRLMQREDQPLVVRLSRMTGQKEVRYMHLLAGEVDVTAVSTAPAVTAPAVAAPREDRVGKLEAEVAELKEQVSRLEAAFAEFRKQFE